MSISEDEISNRSTIAHDEEADAIGLPQGMVLGENGRPAHLGVDSKLLDFFFKVVPDLPANQLREMLEQCWTEDSQVTLKLIFNTGNVRGGKQDKTNFYRAMLWLWEAHPETFLLNLEMISEHTSLKCLLDLVMYIIHKDQNTRFSLEGALKSAKQHADLRVAIRTVMKQHRRQARRARQAAVKQEFAAASGVGDVRNLRQARAGLSKTDIRVSRNACVYCGEQAHWKKLCPSTKENRPPRPQQMSRKSEEEADTDPISVAEAFFFGRSSKSQMARMKKQLELQQCIEDERMKELSCPQHKLRPRPTCKRAEAPAVVSQPAAAGFAQPVSTRWYACTRWNSEEVAQRFQAFIQERDAAYAAAAKAKASDDRAAAQAVAAERIAADPLVRRLHSAVADIFATGLKTELRRAAAGQSVGGLHAKWAPTPGYRHDIGTLLADAIARRLWEEEGEGEEDAQRRAMRLRRRYRKEVLSPLREKAKIPEHFLGKGEWSAVDHAAMPSRCRLLYGASVYGKHDRKRYAEFLLQAAKDAICGKLKKGPKATAILPHELAQKAEMRVRGVCSAAGPSRRRQACPAPTLRIPDKEMDRLRGLEDNLLWRSHVQACRAARAGAGLMVPVCDVSGSMSGTPMQVAVALSLLMAESAPADSPWRGKMFTFHTNPKLVDVPGIPEDCDGSTDLEGVSADELASRLGDVGERVGHVKGIEWGGSTDVERVFDLVLQTALDTGLPSDEVANMTVVIFSDMEFDAARGRTNVPWETAHEAICATFRDAGYRTPPTLVYWNLRASRSVPVDNGSTPGVQLVSGFSAGMMSSFLAGEDVSSTVHGDEEQGQERQHAEKKTAQEKMMEMLDKRVYAALRVAEVDQPRDHS